MSFTWKGKTWFTSCIEHARGSTEKWALSLESRRGPTIENFKVRMPLSACPPLTPIDLTRPYPHIRTPSPVCHAVDKSNVWNGYPDLPNKGTQQNKNRTRGNPATGSKPLTNSTPSRRSYLTKIPTGRAARSRRDNIVPPPRGSLYTPHAADSTSSVPVQHKTNDRPRPHHLLARPCGK